MRGSPVLVSLVVCCSVRCDRPFVRRIGVLRAAAGRRLEYPEGLRQRVLHRLRSLLRRVEQHGVNGGDLLRRRLQLRQLDDPGRRLPAERLVRGAGLRSLGQRPRLRPAVRRLRQRPLDLRPLPRRRIRLSRPARLTALGPAPRLLVSPSRRLLMRVPRALVSLLVAAPLAWSSTAAARLDVIPPARAAAAATGGSARHRRQHRDGRRRRLSRHRRRSGDGGGASGPAGGAAGNGAGGTAGGAAASGHTGGAGGTAAAAPAARRWRAAARRAAARVDTPRPAPAATPPAAARGTGGDAGATAGGPPQTDHHVGRHLEPGLVRRVQRQRRPRFVELGLREGLRPQSGAAVVPARQRDGGQRPADHRRAAGPHPEPELRRRQQRLEDQPPVLRLHVDLDDDVGQARVPVRPVRDARQDRHPPGELAGVLDPRRRHLLAGVGRGRHHGVLRQQGAGERLHAGRQQLHLGQHQPVARLAGHQLGRRLPRLGDGVGRHDHQPLPRRQAW